MRSIIILMVFLAVVFVAMSYNSWKNFSNEVNGIGGKK
jgi:hypothetical protein